MRSLTLKRYFHTKLLWLFCLVLAFVMCGCAASTRGVDPAKPRAESPYPVTLSASAERTKASRDAWTLFVAEQGITDAPQPELQPITATVKTLSVANLGAPIKLPSVGDVKDQVSEEQQTREALRRFLTSATVPLGIRPAELSLVAHEDLPDGRKRVVYQQNSFAYPLRGGYGRVELIFTPDRRVTSLSSTTLPDVERLRTALAAITQERITAEQAIASVAGRTINFNDATGAAQTRLVAAQGEAVAREIVVYPLRSKTDSAVLEIHLAWEIAIGANASLLVYVDAITGEQIGVEPAATIID